LEATKRDSSLILLVYHLAHARAANPIAEIYCIPVPVVVIKFVKAIDKEICPGIVRELMPFAFVPKVCNSAEESSLKLVNAPKRFDSDDLAVG
jgi:hypothetical protein